MVKWLPSARLRNTKIEILGTLCLLRWTISGVLFRRCPPNKHSTNTINVALLEPLQSYEPMESTAVSLPLEETPEFLKVPTH